MKPVGPGHHIQTHDGCMLCCLRHGSTVYVVTRTTRSVTMGAYHNCNPNLRFLGSRCIHCTLQGRAEVCEFGGPMYSKNRCQKVIRITDVSLTALYTGFKEGVSGNLQIN